MTYPANLVIIKFRSSTKRIEIRNKKVQELFAIKSANKHSATVKDLLTLVNSSIDEIKADDLVVVDLNGKSSIADFLVIASGRSDRHVGAIAEHLLNRVKEIGLGRCKVEGLNKRDWVLIDLGEIIVHLFRPEVREFYKLEKIWSIEMTEPEQATR